LAPLGLSSFLKQRDRLGLAPDSVVADALIFERLAEARDAEGLRRAATLYRGELLKGLCVGESAFEDWLAAERERYRGLAVAVLTRLLSIERGQTLVAVSRRLIELDPLAEQAHRALMRAHAEAGEIGAALRQYESCRQMLQRELDVGPSPETEALRGTIAARLSAGEKTIAAIRAAPRDHDGIPRQETRPSLAVLPFLSAGGGSELGLGEAVAEELIRALSRFRSLVVLARDSSFAYGQRPVNVRRLGMELGIDYAVDGSLRRVGAAVRLYVQLIDTVSGSTVWAERYDCQAEEILTALDHAVAAIASALSVELEGAALSAVSRRPLIHLSAFDCWLRGKRLLDSWSPHANEEASRLFRRALEVDPSYARAHAGLAAACEWAS
jgi:TolB-like protein